jgi:multiple sugar transport system substrate-binding protein
VQPAVRRALRRDDIWGAGVTMSVDSYDTVNGLNQFMDTYEADYVTRDGRLVIDDPDVRRRLIKAIDSYTAVYRKDCTPPDSVSWTNADNNEQFLAQTIVMVHEPDARDQQHHQGELKEIARPDHLRHRIAAGQVLAERVHHK